jgi:hypothetical protein
VVELLVDLETIRRVQRLPGWGRGVLSGMQPGQQFELSTR